MTFLPNSSAKYTFQIEGGDNIWLSLSLIVSLKLLSIVQRVVASVGYFSGSFPFTPGTYVIFGCEGFGSSLCHVGSRTVEIYVLIMHVLI
jgi:hypothetical protein